MRRWAVVWLLSLLGAFAIDVGLLSPAPAVDAPTHHARRGFRNTDPAYHYPVLERTRHVLRPAPARGRVLAAIPNDGTSLTANAEFPTVTWIGHSTFLIQLDGVNILTDPHWTERASPVTFAGPRRLIAPGIEFEKLPPIHAVLISHDHYDHLDVTTVLRLARDHHPTFFVPLGLRAWFGELGIDAVQEFDWWEERNLAGLTVTCTPAQHSSGRSLFDQDRRLWSSWVLTGRGKRLFFAGDTGYTPMLKDIGRLGPFDLALLPIGGYNDKRVHHPNHLNPEEAIRLFEDLNGRLMVPMHWGTFDFNREPFGEPPDRLRREAERRGIAEHVLVLSPGQTIRW